MTSTSDLRWRRMQTQSFLGLDLDCDRIFKKSWFPIGLALWLRCLRSYSISSGTCKSHLLSVSNPVAMTCDPILWMLNLTRGIHHKGVQQMLPQIFGTPRERETMVRVPNDLIKTYVTNVKVVDIMPMSVPLEICVSRIRMTSVLIVILQILSLVTMRAKLSSDLLCVINWRKTRLISLRVIFLAWWW